VDVLALIGDHSSLVLIDLYLTTDSSICACRLADDTMSSAVDTTTGGENKKRTSWPEAVGLPVKEAKEIILKDMPGADIVVLPVGSFVTQELNPNRVRIFVDTVAQTPRVG
jgi:hypothetical protein